MPLNMSHHFQSTYERELTDAALNRIKYVKDHDTALQHQVRKIAVNKNKRTQVKPLINSTAKMSNTS